MSDTQEKIKELIGSKQVTVFMKGTPEAPRCGFSAQAIEALKYSGLEDGNLAYFDVLSDPEVRQGVKDYTNWPTIPQVFVRGEFIGGSDIVIEMARNGELEQKLKTN